jgi:serine/threonine protein kinase
MAGDPKVLGHYRIERTLGKGAMGVVYEGLDLRLHRKVAIKTIIKAGQGDTLAQEYTNRFLREAQAVARLNHPNIVHVYDFGEEGDISFIVMEYIAGRDLKSLIEAKEKFELKETLRMICELLDALDFAHAAGVVHRDIKPANMMLDAQRRVKLTDFGVARLTDVERTRVELTQAGTMVGTPAYMSPEQVQGLPIDHRTDIFSAGVVLYQMLTGQKPFEGGAFTVAKRIVESEPPPPSAYERSISPELDRVVAKALAKQPDQRFARAGDFAKALERVFDPQPAGTGATDTKPIPVDEDATLIAPTKPMSFDSPTRFDPPTMTSSTRGPQPGHGSEADVEFWRTIKDSSEIEDMEFYVQKFPEGIYVDLAKRKMAKLRQGGAVRAAEETSGTRGRNLDEEFWRGIKDSNDADDFELYMERFPQGLYVDIAKRRIAKFNRTVEEDNTAGARSRQDEELWRGVRDSTDPADIEHYLEKFPQGAYIDLARRKIARLRGVGAEDSSAIIRRSEAEAGRRAEEAREAEAKAKREAEEKAKQEAEEKARREAEERAKREAEEKARREAEERAKREAEAKAKREAEEKAKREAAERSAREAEEKAKREAEEKARREAEAKAKREAEEKARREAEEKAKREAEAKAKREAEEKARREAEEKAKREAEAKAKREAEEKAKREAEEKAKREAEAKAKREAEEKREAEARAKRDAEERAKRDAEQKARAEADAREAEERSRKAMAKLEAWEKSKTGVDEKTRRDDDRTQVVQRDTVDKARLEAQEADRRKAEEKTKREAEEKAKRDAEKKAQPAPARPAAAATATYQQVPEEPEAKSKTPLIAVGVVAVLAIGGAIAYFVTRPSAQPAPPPSAEPTGKAVPAPAPAVEPKKAEPVVPPPPPPEKAAPTPVPEAEKAPAPKVEKAPPKVETPKVDERAARETAAKKAALDRAAADLKARRDAEEKARREAEEKARIDAAAAKDAAAAAKLEEERKAQAARFEEERKKLREEEQRLNEMRKKNEEALHKQRQDAEKAKAEAEKQEKAKPKVFVPPTF